MIRIKIRNKLNSSLLEEPSAGDVASDTLVEQYSHVVKIDHKDSN